MKHTVNGDRQAGWYCYQCDFTTRDVSEAAAHDGLRETGRKPAAPGVSGEAQPPWKRQESCSECDGDGCLKCRFPFAVGDRITNGSRVFIVRGVDHENYEAWAEPEGAGHGTRIINPANWKLSAESATSGLAGEAQPRIDELKQTAPALSPPQPAPQPLVSDERLGYLHRKNCELERTLAEHVTRIKNQREEIKRLQEKVGELCYRCKTPITFDSKQNRWRHESDELEIKCGTSDGEAQPENSAWILCSERLPRHVEGRFVDVVIGGIVQKSPALLEVGDDDIERWYWVDEDADPAPLHVVSHWRERPKFIPAAPPSQETPK